MAYLLQVWEQPSDLPLPESEAEIWRMLERLRDDAPGPNPKYAQLADELMAIYPEVEDPDDESDVWLDGRADGTGAARVWNLALSTAGPLDEAQAVIASRAVRAGLNMADSQAADLYLADGRIFSRRAEAPFVHAFAAYYTGHKREAWELWVPLGAGGHATVLKQMSSMALMGEAVPKNPALGHALLTLAGETSEAKQLARFLPPDVLARAAEILRQLRVPGEFESTVRSLTERRAPRTEPDVLPQPAVVAAAVTAPAPEPAPALAPASAVALEPVPVPTPEPVRAPHLDPTPLPTTATRPRGSVPVHFATMSGGDWLALNIGVFGMFIVLLLALVGATTSALVFATGVALASAWGTWRGAHVLGFETGKAIAWTAVALVPFVGIGVCILFLLSLMRSRN